MKTIYLAGLISTEYPESLIWRGAAKRLLLDLADEHGKDVNVLDPLRGKGDLSRTSKDGGVTADAVFTPGDIILRDFHDVLISDIILVNLNDFGSPRPMVGTFYELAWAWDHKKLVVAVGGNKLMRTHPFVVQSVTHYFDTAEEACRFIVGRVL